MEPLLIQTRGSYWTVYTVVAVIVFETILSLFDKDSLLVWLLPTVVLSALALLCYWMEFIRSRRMVEIDKQHNEVSVYSVSMLLAPKVTSWPLDRFRAIRCYTSFSGAPENRVELVGQTDGESLLIASFSPDKERQSFWSMPTLAENPRATALRKQLAAHTGLEDQGFLGARLGNALRKV